MVAIAEVSLLHGNWLANWLPASQQKVITAPPTYTNLPNSLVILVLNLTCLYSKAFYLEIFENTFIVKYLSLPRSAVPIMACGSG